MKLPDISQEELESMNYDDIAYHIVKSQKKALKINELFSKVCEVLGDDEKMVADKLVDFFELLTTDKRFIMLEDGSWDLKEKHNPKVIIDDEEDETLIDETEDNDDNIDPEQDDNSDIFYDSESDDDIPDDDLEDLVVIDVDEDEANS